MRTLGFALMLVTAGAFASESVIDESVPAPAQFPVELLSPERRATPVQPYFELLEPDMVWVEDTLASMTLQQKIGQMIMPSYGGSAASQLADYHVGGFIFLGNSNTRSAIQGNTNALQALATHPLIFAIDCETGGGARMVTGEGTDFPHNMAVSSANDLALTEMAGRITARECRSIGVHMGFSPVLDVNTDPDNPIIGIRSYGSFPSRVADMAEAYITGANAEGLLCTFKHFPGHGPTDVDSHLALPVVSIPCTELQDTHIAPYATLIGKGLGDLVMSAHIWYQCLDPGVVEVPATLSSAAMTDILRTQLGFQGIVISDAFSMDGLSVVSGPAEAAVRGVQSGLDIILMPSDVALTVSGIEQAIIDGDITEERIDDSVRRILAAKTRVGLHLERFTSETLADEIFSDPTHQQTANTIGAMAIAATRVDPTEFPVDTTEDVLLISVAQSSSIFYTESSTYFRDELSSLIPGLQIILLDSSPDSSERATAISAALAADKVILAMYDWLPQYSSNATQRANKIALVNGLLATGTPMAYVSFGSPYQIRLFEDEMKNFYCAFTSQRGAQVEMAHILVGEAQPQGDWPVSLNLTGVNGWQILD